MHPNVHHADQMDLASAYVTITRYVQIESSPKAVRSPYKARQYWDGPSCDLSDRQRVLYNLMSYFHQFYAAVCISMQNGTPF
uniref:Uncharacterized protein n=1 Tax=Panagrellus redivivus TaxID=6233 RepID=A0A7E4VBI1_PANRE